MGSSSTKQTKVESQGQVTDNVVVQDAVNIESKEMLLLLILIVVILLINLGVKIYQCHSHGLKKKYQGRVPAIA